MSNIDQLKQAAFAAIDALRDEAVAIAKDMHANPELGWETPRSAGLLTDYLEKHGMNVEKAVAGVEVDYSFRATGPNGNTDGPGIALLAEYDALPEIGHACSHSLIGTIAATAGIAVNKVLGDLPGGNVYVMGCPFEEGGGGKIYMIENGAFEPTDVSLMFHGGADVRVGSPNIAACSMTYEFFGQPSHSGASPEKGINAADAAMLTFAGVNAMRQHTTSDSRISGVIEDGGTAMNVTPEYARVVMMTRAATYESVQELRERVHNCARGAATMTGTRLEIHEEPVYAERLIVPSLKDVVHGNLGLVDVPQPDGDPQTFASADSGNVSQYIPHVTFMLPMDDKGSTPHTAAFAAACNTEFAFEQMIKAAKIMAATAIDLLSDHDRVAAIKAEHSELKAAKTA